jgi:DNA-binding transcriptional LysR family regulator
LRQARRSQLAGSSLTFGLGAHQYVSQPGLSQQIKALEEEVGALLLERTKRTVALTEAGKYFLEEAKLTLEHAERAKAGAQQVAGGKLGTVRIGYVHSVAFSGQLAELASLFRSWSAGIHLEFGESWGSDQMSRLVKGELDLGFIRLPLEGVPPEIAITTLMQQKILVALNKHRALAKKKRTLCAELKNEQLVLFLRPDGKSVLDDHVWKSQLGLKLPQKPQGSPVRSRPRILKRSFLGAQCRSV